MLANSKDTTSGVNIPISVKNNVIYFELVKSFKTMSFPYASFFINSGKSFCPKYMRFKYL